MEVIGFMMEDIDEFIIYLSTLQYVNLCGDELRISPFVKSDDSIKIRTLCGAYYINQSGWISWLRNYKIELINE